MANTHSYFCGHSNFMLCNVIFYEFKEFKRPTVLDYHLPKWWNDGIETSQNNKHVAANHLTNILFISIIIIVDSISSWYLFYQIENYLNIFKLILSKMMSCQFFLATVPAYNQRILADTIFFNELKLVSHLFYKIVFYFNKS